MTRQSDLAHEVTSTFFDKYGPRPELDVSGEDARWHDGSLYSAVSATWHVDALVSNGGWPSVYYDGASRLVPIARDFLNDLGAVGLASACDAAIALGKQTYARLLDSDEPTHQWLEQSLCEHTTDAEWDVPDDTWTKYAQTEDWWRLAADAITKSHPEIVEPLASRDETSPDPDTPRRAPEDAGPPLFD